jgi:hypothetical protein
LTYESPYFFTNESTPPSSGGCTVTPNALSVLLRELE